MSVSNLSKDLGSRYFSVPQPFGKAGGLSAPAAVEAKPPEDNAAKGQAGVSVSISPDALAAYDASLARMEHSTALAMEDGAQFVTGYDLRKLKQQEAVGTALGEPPPEGAADGDVDSGSVSPTPIAANGVPSLRTEDLSKAADLALQDVRQKLDQAFALKNISNAPPVSLAFDDTGTLVVGDHPDRAKIEDLFAQNGELANEVRTAHALKENAVTWEKASLYSAAHDQTYNRNGPAAADGVTELFLAIGDEGSIVTYGPSGLDLSYDGAPPKDHLASIASRLGLGTAA